MRMREETTKMTSKGKQPEDKEPEIDYEYMLLKRFRIVESVIEEARKYNKEHGIDEQTSNANVVFTKTNKQKSYERWLKQCINPDTNQFYTMDFLKAKKIVARIDSPYDGIQYPRREMFQLYRIKEQSGEYLNRREMWYGLNVEGKEINIYVETLDDHRDLQIVYPKLEDLNQTRYMGDGDDIPGYGKTLAKVRNTNLIYTDQEEGRIVYDTPFSEAAVLEAAKYARGSFYDRNNGCALAFTDKSRSGNSYSVFSLDQFLQPFDQVWDELTRPKDKGVDVKDLIRQLRDENMLGKGKDEADKLGKEPYK
jgi:hypothetical protein